MTGPADEGNKAENAVFMEFYRKKIECGYFAESEKEVDFVLGDRKEPVPVEVKYISVFDWNDRRFAGIRLFLRRFPKTSRALLITKNVETRLTVNKAEIKAIPIWRFLLSSESHLRS